MPYAAESDALPYLRRLNMSATSIVTLADLDTFLQQRSDELDAVLKSRGLSVPVTAPAEFVARLRGLNAKGAAADAMNAFYVTNDGNDRGSGASLLKEFTDALKGFVNGDGIPVGSAVAETDLAVRSPWSGPNARPYRPLFSSEAREGWDR